MILIDRIKRIMDEQGISQYRLGKLAGVPHSTMSTLLSGGIKNPSLDMVAKIAGALGVSVSTLIEEQIQDTGMDGAIKQFFNIIGKPVINRAPFAGKIESELWANLDDLTEGYGIKMDIKINAQDPERFNLLADAICAGENEGYKSEVLIMVKKLASKYHLWESPIPTEETGMNFYGGSERYTEDEIEVMEAALKAYREQKKKFLNKM